MGDQSRTPIGSLEDIWTAQGSLNQKVGIDTLSLGKELATNPPSLGATDQGTAALPVGRALKNYIDAMVAECHELQECLSWKHWYREARAGRQYELRDVQNARVEAIDMLFFWVSVCQLLGLAPADVYRLYQRKLDINLRRQEEDRAQADHQAFESENRTVV